MELASAIYQAKEERTGPVALQPARGPWAGGTSAQTKTRVKTRPGGEDGTTSDLDGFCPKKTCPTERTMDFSVIHSGKRMLHRQAIGAYPLGFFLLSTTIAHMGLVNSK